MENTWASGAIELLRHADSHINLDTAFDKRIAFISIDNAVETCIRTFLSLPHSKSGIKVPRRDLDDVETSFPGLTTLLWAHASAKLTGIDGADIEHYHRIRNTLYHNGTGLSVDSQYLLAYRQIAALLLKNLFGIALAKPKPNSKLKPKAEPTLERLILLWNQIEQKLRHVLEKHGIDRGHTYFWEEAVQSKVFDMTFVQNLTELRMIRNKQVHSTSVDRKQLDYAVDLAERVLNQIEETSRDQSSNP